MMFNSVWLWKDQSRTAITAPKWTNCSPSWFALILIALISQWPCLLQRPAAFHFNMQAEKKRLLNLSERSILLRFIWKSLCKLGGLRRCARPSSLCLDELFQKHSLHHVGWHSRPFWPGEIKHGRFQVPWKRSGKEGTRVLKMWRGKVIKKRETGCVCVSHVI